MIVAGTIGIGAIAAPAIARADCLTDNIDTLGDHGVFVARRMTMSLVTDGGGWVSYSRGLLLPNDATSGRTGFIAQVFSDRFSGNQPFSANASDQMIVVVHDDGLITVHNETWNFDWSVRVSCVPGTTSLAVGNVGGTEVIVSFSDFVSLFEGN